ncbi:MAG TPA: YceI family protein, partial [Mycobacterium sp.]
AKRLPSNRSPKSRVFPASSNTAASWWWEPRRTRARVIDLRVEDLGNSWRKSFEADVCQSEFAVKPYSLLMGSMKVVDAVTVSVTVDRAKDD